MDEEIPNPKLKSGKTIISTCKLCLCPFFDPSPTRKACHLLGIPGSGISKCEHRGDLPEEIKLILKDSCEPVRRWFARGAGGPSPLFGCGSPTPHVPQVASNSSSPAPPPRTSRKQSTMPKMLKNEETAYWDRRCVKEVLYQGNMAWSTPGKSGWSNFLNDLAMSKPINWQPPKRRKIRELLPEQYTQLKRDMDLHEAGAEFISGSLDGVDLLNRTHVLGKSKITTRGPTFAGALDTTGVALMGTDFMSEQCQELIADCGGAPKCPSVCLDGASANKSGMRKSEQLSPTVAHTLCQFHGVSLWFNDVFNLPLVKDVVYKPALLVAKKFRGNKFARDQLQAMQQTASFKVMPQFIRGSKSFLLPPKTRACGKRIMLSRFADLHSSALATTVDPAWAVKFEG